MLPFTTTCVFMAHEGRRHSSRALTGLSRSRPQAVSVARGHVAMPVSPVCRSVLGPLSRCHGPAVSPTDVCFPRPEVRAPVGWLVVRPRRLRFFCAGVCVWMSPLCKDASHRSRAHPVTSR